MNLLDSARHVLAHGFAVIDDSGAVIPTPDAVYDTLETDPEPDVDGVLLDAVTANLVVQVCDRLSEANRAKLLAMDPVRAVDVCWKLVRR